MHIHTLIYHIHTYYLNMVYADTNFMFVFKHYFLGDVSFDGVEGCKLSLLIIMCFHSCSYNHSGAIMFQLLLFHIHLSPYAVHKLLNKWVNGWMHAWMIEWMESGQLKLEFPINANSHRFLIWEKLKSNISIFTEQWGLKYAKCSKVYNIYVVNR